MKTLVLHLNRFQPPPRSLPESWRARLGRIESLGLDGTLMTWDEVVRLSPALVGLRELQLGSNEISSLVQSAEGKGEILPNLATLSLEDNNLSSWSDLVTALARLPALESLNLNRNQFRDIPAAPLSAATPKLKSLKDLHLRENQLSDWVALENLSSWLDNGGLEALHISKLPSSDDFDEHKDVLPSTSTAADSACEGAQSLLSKFEYRDFRALAIALLPTLRVLDKTEITAKERKDAELFVYSRFRDGDVSIIYGHTSQGREEGVELSTEVKVALFPRYLELAKLYGDGEDAVGVKGAGKVKRKGKARR